MREAKPEKACLSCCPALQNIFAGGGKGARNAGGGGKRLRFALRRLRGQGGFSIVGMMVASAVGIVILTGTTQLFVEMSQKIDRVEKRQQKQLFYNYLRRHFADSDNCKATLNAKGGAGAVKHYYAAADAANKDLDGDASTPDDHQYKIGRLLMPDNTNKPDDSDSLPDIKIDFYPTAAADKKDIKQRLRNKWGIESLGGVTYVHDTTDGPYLSVVTNRLVHGVIPVPDKRFKIPLKIQTSGATGSDKGDKIACCSSDPSQCAAAAEGGASCGRPGESHSNGGGFVAYTATVSPDVFVGPNAKVCDNATVSGRVEIRDNASVYFNANIRGPGLTSRDTDGVKRKLRLRGNAVVSGNARLYGPVQVSENAQIYGSAYVMRKSTDWQNKDGPRIFKDAKVYGDAQVWGHTKIHGKAKVYFRAKVWGRASVYGEAQVLAGKVSGQAEIYDKGSVSGGHVYGEAKVYGEGKVYGTAKVYDTARVYDRAHVRGDAKVYDRAWVYGDAEVRGEAQVYNKAHVYGHALVFEEAQIYDYAQVSGGSTPRTKVCGQKEVSGFTHLTSGMHGCGPDH